MANNNQGPGHEAAEATETQHVESNSTKSSNAPDSQPAAALMQARASEHHGKSPAADAAKDPEEAAKETKEETEKANATDVAAGAEKKLEGAEQELEKDTEAAVDTVAEGSAKAVETVAEDGAKTVEAIAGEAIKDVNEAEGDLMKGEVGEGVEAVKREALDTDPCTSIGSCIHSIALNFIVFMVGAAVYLSCMFEKRKTETPETPLNKADFTGNMEPVSMSPCPGGMFSGLCFAAYLCLPCFRVELLGKLEKWDSAKTKMNIYFFVAIVMLGHVVIVSIAIVLGFSKNMVHFIGLVSLPITWIGILALGYKMAQWRLVMKGKKAEGTEDAKPPNSCNEIMVSSLCAPCAGGQEAEFIEKYEDTFGKTEW